MMELLLTGGYFLIGALTGGFIYAYTDDDILSDALVPQEVKTLFGSIFWPVVPFVLAGLGFGRLLKGIKERRLALAEQREREALEAEDEIRKVLGS